MGRSISGWLVLGVALPGCGGDISVFQRDDPDDGYDLGVVFVDVEDGPVLETDPLDFNENGAYERVSLTVDADLVVHERGEDAPVTFTVEATIELYAGGLPLDSQAVLLTDDTSLDQVTFVVDVANYTGDTSEPLALEFRAVVDGAIEATTPYTLRLESHEEDQEFQYIWKQPPQLEAEADANEDGFATAMAAVFDVDVSGPDTREVYAGLSVAGMSTVSEPFTITYRQHEPQELAVGWPDGEVPLRGGYTTVLRIYEVATDDVVLEYAWEPTYWETVAHDDRDYIVHGVSWSTEDGDDDDHVSAATLTVDLEALGGAVDHSVAVAVRQFTNPFILHNMGEVFDQAGRHDVRVDIHPEDLGRGTYEFRITVVEIASTWGTSPPSAVTLDVYDCRSPTCVLVPETVVGVVTLDQHDADVVDASLATLVGFPLEPPSDDHTPPPP